MYKAKLSWLFILNVFLLITVVVSLARPNLVQSATASHVVISEVQIGLTGDAANEFVEIYNPTGAAVNIGGWKIAKKTAAADPTTETEVLATVPSGTSIASHGYYLVAHTDYVNASVAEDLTYNDNPISSNNTIYLKNAADTVIDKLGFGSTTDFEGTAKGNPPATGSVERKANSASTTATMIAADAVAGNGEDTDDNSLDFVNRAVSEPQNSASATETPGAAPSGSASAAPSASPSPSESVSPSASPSPSDSASPSASPSVAPSASPSASASVTPSASPSASASVSPSTSPSSTPSASPSASVSPTPSASSSASPSASVSASPSAQPSKTPKPSSTPKPHKTLVCKFETKTLDFGLFKITFPDFVCNWMTF